MAYDEKELVYNLYPLQVGWQELPVLTLEYNTKADPQKHDGQNALLDELVQRALPKRVFVLVSGRVLFESFNKANYCASCFAATVEAADQVNVIR